jgi:hypothetical protein
MIIGGTLLAVGAILCWWRPFRGGLPGDIVIERPGFSFHFPVVWACFDKTDREKGGYWLVVFEFKLSG